LPDIARLELEMPKPRLSSPDRCDMQLAIALIMLVSLFLLITSLSRMLCPVRFQILKLAPYAKSTTAISGFRSSGCQSTDESWKCTRYSGEHAVSRGDNRPVQSKKDKISNVIFVI